MAMKHNLLKPSVDIHTFIINLFQDNDEELSIYEDTRLVCRDGSVFSSRLLLSLAFPTLGRSLALLGESIEPVIILPDYSAEEVKKVILNWGPMVVQTMTIIKVKKLDSPQNNINWYDEYQANIKDEVGVKSEVQSFEQWPADQVAS